MITLVLTALIVLCAILASALAYLYRHYRQLHRRYLESFDAAWQWFDQYHELREDVYALALWRDNNHIESNS
jgi:hypothetical protein